MEKPAQDRKILLKAIHYIGNEDGDGLEGPIAWNLITDHVH